MTKAMQELCNKREQLLEQGKTFVAEGNYEGLDNVNKQVRELDSKMSSLELFENSAKTSTETQPVKESKKFNTLAEQLKAIKDAAYGNVDERLIKNDLSGGLNTNNNTDGGYAIQSDFIGAILDRVYENSEVVNRCSTFSITKNSNRANWVTLDDSQDATKDGVVVAGGVQVYWAEEGTTVLKSKPQYKNEELKLAKIMGICYTTEEMLQDVPFTAQVVEDSFSDATDALLRNGIYNGLGHRDSYADQPFGILNSNALVTVTATSTKLTAQDLLNMKAAMRKKNWANAVWVMHPDMEADLPLLNDGGTNLVFMPAGGLSGAQYDTILGRPVIYDEYLATKGTKGDILLADFNEYILIKKGEERKDWSMHVAFLTDEQVFRIVLRVNGKPKRNNTYAVRNSSKTRGAFVTLSARGTQLTAPTVTITSHTASWTAIDNATGYTYAINDGTETTTTLLTVSGLTSGDVFKIKANGNGSTYIDSVWATTTDE